MGLWLSRVTILMGLVAGATAGFGQEREPPAPSPLQEVPAPFPAEETEASPRALRVFLDCGACDFDYYRQSIPWIDWVRDRQDAQIHLLVTTRTAAASIEHTLEFVGREEFSGQDQVLTVSVGVTDTADEQRETLARLVRVGLARYAAQTSGGRSLDVLPGAPGELGVTEPGEDPWNFWVFSMGLNGSFNGEARSESLEYSAAVSANRTTDEWRHSFWATTSRADDEFVFEDGSTLESVARLSDAGFQAVKSLGEHWGAGIGWSRQRSTFTNTLPSYRVAAAVEYDVFPYDESAQRLLSVAYFVGGTQFNYEEETIYGVSGETLLDHGVVAQLDLTRPWGSSSVDVLLRQYFQHPGQYRLALEGTLSYRLVRGLSLNVFAGYAVVRDQRYLARRGATDDEVLLRRRALETDYSAFVTVGVSYTFGSIFNRTVNSRLTGNSGRFERVF